MIENLETGANTYLNPSILFWQKDGEDIYKAKVNYTKGHLNLQTQEM